MGRTLQNRKRRSSRAKIRQSNKPKKALHPTGNGIVAQNWNKKETLTQNYRRLGLMARLGAPTGGNERRLGDPAAPEPRAFSIAPTEKRILSEARVERDADGRIVRIITSKSARVNPLNDPLNELESDSEDGEGHPPEGSGDGAPDGNPEDETRPRVVRELERQSREATKAKRRLCETETAWLRGLLERHGTDTRAMFWDKKLNPMQLTEADIKRRLKSTFGPDWSSS